MKFYYKDGSILDNYYNDKILHRLDGPAFEWLNGRKSWYIDGEFLTEEQFNNHPKVQLEEVLSER